MFEWIINYATLIAFISFIIDNLLQIKHIWKRKSSKDISLRGVYMRAIAAIILLIKYITIQDIYLTIGQTLFTITFATYVFLLLRYR